jgi:hypothetical protein
MELSLFKLGVPPCARTYFLLLCQKKVAKEKATPGSAPGYARSLALLGRPGGWLNSPAAQTTPTDCPRPACVAQRLSGGPGKASRHNRSAPPIACCGRPRKTANFARRPQHHHRFTGPLGRCRATQGFAEKGRALFEGRRPELRSPRETRVAQGTRQSRAPTQGWPSFCLLFLGHSRKSRPAGKAEPGASESQTPQSPNQKIQRHPNP